MAVSGSSRSRLGLAAGIGLGAGGLWLLTGGGLVTYDTVYALVWGRQLAHGEIPDIEGPGLPTPHPLANLAGGVLAPLTDLEVGGVHGTAASDLVLALSFVALATTGWIVFALGRAWFNAAAGALAAAIVVTRAPMLDFSARAFLDIPYLALVLGALLIETRRRRAGAPVVALLVLAGLLRPEAWLLSGAYIAWLAWPRWRDRRRDESARQLSARLLRELGPLVGLAACAPLLWALSDLVLTGDPLYSYLHTDELAEGGRLKEQSEGSTGIQEVVTRVPPLIRGMMRDEVLLAAAGGAALAIAWRRTPLVLLGVVAGVASFVTFTVLAGAGLPLVSRFLLPTGAILAVFAGGGLLGWLDLPSGRRRTAWAVFGALAFALLAAGLPTHREGMQKVAEALDTEQAIRDDLAALVGQGLPCQPVTVPNHRPVPQVALWLDLRPTEIEQAQARLPTSGTYLLPRSARIAYQDRLLDRRDGDARIPAPPLDFPDPAQSEFWRAASRCDLMTGAAGRARRAGR